MIFFHLIPDAGHAADSAGDAISILLTLAAFADILPGIAALFSIIWVIIRIWETRTVQRWIYGKDDPDAKA